MLWLFGVGDGWVEIVDVKLLAVDLEADGASAGSSLLKLQLFSILKISSLTEVQAHLGAEM